MVWTCYTCNYMQIYSDWCLLTCNHYECMFSLVVGNNSSLLDKQNRSVLVDNSNSPTRFQSMWLQSTHIQHHDHISDQLWLFLQFDIIYKHNVQTLYSSTHFMIWYYTKEQSWIKSESQVTRINCVFMYSTLYAVIRI